MHFPDELLGFDGKAMKGEVYLKGGTNAKLKEEGMKQEGNHFTCYALTAEDDAITACLTINSGVVEFVDVVVDGILRASHCNDKATKKFTKNFDWFAGQVKTTRNIIVAKSYQLQIAKRNVEKSQSFFPSNGTCTK